MIAKLPVYYAAPIGNGYKIIGDVSFWGLDVVYPALQGNPAKSVEALAIDQVGNVIDTHIGQPVSSYVGAATDSAEAICWGTGCRRQEEMYWVLLGIASIIVAIVRIAMARRCRRYPENCKDLFMRQNGMMNSFLAWPYIGKPDIARDTFVKNPKLRKAWVIEQYIWAVVCFILGVLLISLPLLS